MSIYFPNPPSWDNHSSNNFSFKKVSFFLEKELKAVFGSCEILKLSISSKSNIRGFYKLVCKDKKTFFVKILLEDEYNHIVKQDEIYNYLEKALINFPKPIKRYTKPFFNNYFIVTYPYIEHRYFKPNYHDIMSISKNLFKLHQIKYSKNLITKIKNNTEVREDFLLRDIDVKIKSIKIVDYRVYTLLKRNKTLLFKDFGDKIISHGDLNVHNIIFDSYDNLIFLDFEDMLHSYVSPIHDFAKVIERFILLSRVPHLEKKKLLDYFLKNYNKKYNFREIYLSIKYLSIKSLLILTNLYYEKNTWNKNEVNKFVKNITFLEKHCKYFFIK